LSDVKCLLSKTLNKNSEWRFQGLQRMKSKAARPKGTGTHVADRRPPPPSSIPAAQALSFLKETRGVLTWTLSDLAKTLNISKAAAEQVVGILQIQGYVAPKASEWLTTEQGETVSGSKAPRFSRDSVERAVAALSEHIKEINEDRKAAYRITKAVAFGDFIKKDLNKDASRAQSADVGIGLIPRRDAAHSSADRKHHEAFLKQLRNRNAMLNLRPYEEWMSARSHQKLIWQMTDEPAQRKTRDAGTANPR
jgi:hypothetical protein